ncbi:MAG: hypothetical protein Q9M94_04895 [Candidatus Gracilibacteria bacterium]|nr:hypothetical protein [Candidatus Gracilibacteria bacterium]MDQ7022008.1 hypothetical protein [Candidatus Gracilibacteria bacterium]
MPINPKQFEEEKNSAKKTAENTIKKMTKKKSFNLRIFENEIPSIKAIALEKGLPYQTLLSSVIHQVTLGVGIKPTNKNLIKTSFTNM